MSDRTPQPSKLRLHPVSALLWLSSSRDAQPKEGTDALDSLHYACGSSCEWLTHRDGEGCATMSYPDSGWIFPPPRLAKLLAAYGKLDVGGEGRFDVLEVSIGQSMPLVELLEPEEAA